MDDTTRRAIADMWDGGDYDRLADRLRPAAAELARSVGTSAPAGPVLDLAAGTGSVATELAAGGRSVEAIDIAPGLVEIGRRRTEAAGLDVRWRVAGMDDLSGEPASFAAVASSFGLIFAADPTRTLRAIRRLLADDGVVGISVWDRGGYISSMTTAMTRDLPEPGRSAARAWQRWGDSTVVDQWLTGAGFTDIARSSHALPWRFGDASEATEFLFSASPGHVAAEAAVANRFDLRGLVREHLLDFAGVASDRDPIEIEASYQVVTARSS